jgi:hypothetical protein
VAVLVGAAAGQGCESAHPPTGEPYFTLWFIPGTKDAQEFDFLINDLAAAKYVSGAEYYGTTLAIDSDGDGLADHADNFPHDPRSRWLFGDTPAR